MPVFIVPRNPDGSGWMWLRTSPQGERLLRFSELQAKFEERQGVIVEHPADWGYELGTRGSQWFRVVMKTRYPNGQRFMPRFSLPRDTPRKSLHVVAEHFDRVGVEWLRLYDGRGDSHYFDRIRPATQRPA